MLAAALFSALLGPTVSFEADAVRTDLLLKELGRQSGIALECDGNVAAEPLIVQFENQPLDDVLARLATIAGAEWVVSGDSRRLTRTMSLQRAQERKDLDVLTEQIRALLQQTRKEVDGMPAFDEKQAALMVDRYRLAELSGEQQSNEGRRMSTTNPVARAVARIAGEIPPETLARLLKGQRAVFSDHPTHAQRTLPPRALEAISDLRKQIRMMETAKQRLGTLNKPSVNYFGLPAIGPGSLDSGYLKTIVALKRSGATLRYTLVLVDGSGKLVSDGSGSLPNGPVAFEAAYPHQGAKFALSADATAFLKIRNDIGYAWGATSQAKLDDGTMIMGSDGMSMAEANGDSPDFGAGELIGDPVGHDPIGVLAGSLLRQLAKELNKPLIATLADGALTSLSQAVVRQQITTLEDVVGFFEQSATPGAVRTPVVRRIADSDWILYEPFFPASARKSRFDRQALKNWIQIIRKTGNLSLADAAKYLSTCPETPSFNTLDMMYLTHADPKVERGSAERLLTLALPFLVTVKPAQWAPLEKGGIPFESLYPAQQAIIKKWTYDDIDYAHTLQWSSSMDGPDPVTSDPTELFPDGVPLGTRIKVDVKSQLAVELRTKSGYHPVVDLNSLGFQESLPDSRFSENTKVPRVIEGYKPSSTVVYSVKLLFSHQLTPGFSSIEVKPVPNAKEVPRDQLPREYLDKIAVAKDAFSKSRGIPPTGGGVRKPPE